MKSRLTESLAWTTMAIAAAASSTAVSQEDVEEIVVTAQRRAELSRDVPISITSISSGDLERNGIDQLGDISLVTPALRFDAAGSFFQPTIRGVGTAITTSGGGPNVGIYVDGFFSSNPEVADFQLLKVESIQVLKGPQGTLFGRNTTGGAILVTTADPSAQSSAELKASYGSFNSSKAQGYATFGLTDSVAMDVEGVFSNGDGFIENVTTGNDEAGKHQKWSVRTGLKAEITDSASFLLRFTHSETDDPSSLLTNAYVDTDGGAGFFSRLPLSAYGTNDSTGQPLVYLGSVALGAYATDPDEVATPFNNRFTNESDTIQARVNVDLGFAQLTSYSQFRSDESLNLEDLDASALPLFDISIGIDNRTVSQEFLLNSKSGSALQWTAGINYFQNHDTYTIGASFGGAPFVAFGGSDTVTKSYAGFLDLTYEITPQFFATVGARYSHDVVTDAYFNTTLAMLAYEDANGNPVPVFGIVPPQTKIPVDDLKDDRITPRVVLRYKPSDESSIYGSYTRGYKAGILNVGGSSQVPVKPEVIDAFEVGYKYEAGGVSADFATYYYDYKDLQVSSFQSGSAQIRNAAESEIYGAEASVRYRVTQALSFNAAVAYTHARYKSFPNAPFYTYCDPAVPAFSGQPFDCGATGAGALTQVTTDASGYQMQRSPDLTGNVGASYTVVVAGGELTFAGNLYATSKVYFDPSQQFVQEAYEVVGLRAQWVDPSARYTLAVFGDNITDERYRSQVLFNTLGIGNTWSTPATWGVEFGAKF